MNKYAVLVIFVMFGTLFLSVGLRYSQAVLLFGFVAAVLAPIAIHKIQSPIFSVALLMGLASFASSPAKRLFQLDSIPTEVALSIAYAIVLFLVGAGWKRDWATKT